MVVELDQATYKHLLVLILQFLYEENYKSTTHSLERESKIFFNTGYFLETMESGAFEESEKYLSAFTTPSDNVYSQMLFSELHRQRDCRARETSLPTCDASVTRNKIINDQLISIIRQNPRLQDKLVLPNLNRSGLLSIINLVCLNPQEDSRMLSVILLFLLASSNKNSNYQGPSSNVIISSFSFLFVAFQFALLLQEALLFLIYQFLDEENFHETTLELEQEAAIFFNMKHFEKLLLNSEWDKASKYLSAFTSADDNWHSFLMFYGLTVQKFFEVVCSNDDTVSMYVANTRTRLKKDFKCLVQENRSLRDKLKFQCMDKSRLLTLVKHFMDWFRPSCPNAGPNGNRLLSLEGVPEVPCVYHGQTKYINPLCETSLAVADESNHENSRQNQWRIVEVDSVVLSYLAEMKSGRTATADDSSLVGHFIVSPSPPLAAGDPSYKFLNFSSGEHALSDFSNDMNLQSVLPRPCQTAFFCQKLSQHWEEGGSFIIIIIFGGLWLT